LHIKYNYYIKVEWPREGSIAFDVKTKLEPFPLGACSTLIIIKNKSEMKKLWPPKVKGVNNSKKKPPYIGKVGSRKPKKFLVC
jgi:hypothetical protein